MSSKVRKREVQYRSLISLSALLTLCLLFANELHAILFTRVFGNLFTTSSNQSNVVFDRELSGYQERIINETRDFRGLEVVCYKGYCGPWIEEYFMDYFFSNKIQLKRIYVPISWTNCHLTCSQTQLTNLRQYMLDLNTTHKYFTILQIDKGFQHPILNIQLPEELDIMIFCSGGSTRGAQVINIPIPLLKEELHPANRQKTHKISFVGSMTHPCRSELRDMYENSILFTEGEDWKSIVEESTFSLCPRGYGSTSFRLFEAIQLGSIPIYIWDEEILLPFSEKIQWESFSIILHRSQIGNLHSRIDQANLESMAKQLGAVRNHFTYDFTCKYIVDKILEMGI